LVEPGADVAAGKRLAINEFSQAIKINPRYAAAYFSRALTYQQLREERLALADYDRAISIDPKRANTYNNRGILKAIKFNDPQGALADYNRAIALNPKDFQFYNNRGILRSHGWKTISATIDRLAFGASMLSMIWR
jgi:tetratricopeptide (TPR) repeat protein